MLRKCIHGGGTDCERQGGDGSLQHSDAYVHPCPTLDEVGHPLGDYVYKSLDIEKDYVLNDFVVDFNEEEAQAVLDLTLTKGVDVNELLKSLYDFDLDTPEGVQKLMSLIPVLDSVILVDLVEKIWPGYAVEVEDPELLRAEIKGFLLDFLFEVA